VHAGAGGLTWRTAVGCINKHLSLATANMCSHSSNLKQSPPPVLFQQEPEHAAPAPDAEAGLKPSPAPPPSPTPAAAQGAGESTAAAFATPASDGAAAPAGAGATAAATAAAAEPPDELTSQERSEWNQKAFTVQQEMSDLMKAGRQGGSANLSDLMKAGRQGGSANLSESTGDWTCSAVQESGQQMAKASCT